jgi:hypothetical protein
MRVVLRGGTYRLRAPMVFTPDDSGTREGPITYEAYPGESPVISGAVPITGWRQTREGLWTVEIPEVKRGAW